MKPLSDTIASLRREKNETQAALADFLGVSNRTVSKWENGESEPDAAALAAAYGPDKADVVFECAGSDVTMEQAIQNARKGSVIILVAVFGKRASVDLAKLNDSELDLNTSMMYRHEDYVDAIRLVSEGRVRLKPLQSAKFPFLDYKKAYEYIDANRETTMKVLIDLDPTEE